MVTVQHRIVVLFNLTGNVSEVLVTILQQPFLVGMQDARKVSPHFFDYSNGNVRIPVETLQRHSVFVRIHLFSTHTL